MEEVSTVLQGTDCDHFQKEAQLPDNMKEFMGTKLRYQFNAVIKDESLVEHCRAIKVNENQRKCMYEYRINLWMIAVIWVDQTWDTLSYDQTCDQVGRRAREIAKQILNEGLE